MPTSEYECVLSGITVEAAEANDCDGLGTLPVDWTKVTIAKRRYNPKWVWIQRVKEAMISNILAQIPPELVEDQRVAVAIQVEAQFYGLESATPAYFVEEDVVYLSDSREVAESFNEVREMLGLDPAEIEEDESESDDDDDDDESELDDEEPEPEVKAEVKAEAKIEAESKK